MKTTIISRIIQKGGNSMVILTMVFSQFGWAVNNVSAKASNRPTTISNTDTAPTANNTLIDVVSYWRLEEGIGTTANNSVGSNTGVVHGASWVAGQVGTALSFNGSSNYVQIPNSDSLRIPDQVTAEAWIRPTGFNFADQNTIIGKWKDSGSDETHNFNYYLGLRHNGLATFYVGINGVIYGIDGPYLTLNQWYHLAGTYDGSTIRLYVNGSLAASLAMPGTLWTGATDVYIGAAPDGPFPRYFQGQIDEAAIYHRALTLQEIQLHYQYGQAGFSYDYMDTTGPAVDTFTVAALSSFNIPITAFSATDTIGVTGYLITKFAAQPSAEGDGLV